MPDLVDDQDGAIAAEEEIRGLLERARGGDASAVPALRSLLVGRPDLWLAYGDVAAHARSLWIELIAGRDGALRASLESKAAALLDELAGPGAPALERLLAERIVAAWLECGHADAMASQAAGASPKQASFAIKRQESAGRRYLTAIGALAAVRKLLPTATAAVAGAYDGPGGRDEAVPAARPAVAGEMSASGRTLAGQLIPFRRP